VKHFDVVVIGGGHAGAEAAAAAARMGASVALVTLRQDSIGVMSCNPAIGGLGKGHLVREIDALDGVMARAADSAGIQFRLLNRSKGPAVQGPRVQADRDRYRNAVQMQLRKLPMLEVIEGEVCDLITRSGRTAGILLQDGTRIGARATVLTTGTFLGGRIHIGDEVYTAGRIGERSVSQIGERLRDVCGRMGRLKTGTPPRLDSHSIDWSVLEEQGSDDEPTMLSFLSLQPILEQMSCAITHTNEKTHEIIRTNIHRSAMASGEISGPGPRYCPSIEDKVQRFPDKSTHQVFLEPEGLQSNAVYPNGISCSLPRDVQEEYVRSIVGLEYARIEQPGYAVEYDYVDPRGLNLSLELRELPRLFLAGQINGTTGYEEAAAQGLIAGVNAAALALGRKPLKLTRTNSYIGVMIDDLVTRGVTEPYRMFTSRAEFRLNLRPDNADQRLTPLGIDVGCVTVEREEHFSRKYERLSGARAVFESATFTPNDLELSGLRVKNDGVRRNGMEVLALPGACVSALTELIPATACLDREIAHQLEREAVYYHYIERQASAIEALQRDASLALPAEMDYGSIGGLSNELKQKLSEIRPETLDQAGRIEGMTPAALTLLAARIRRSVKAAGSASGR